MSKKIKASMEDRYKFYYGIGRLFNSSINISFLLDTVISNIVEEMNAEAGAFWLYDAEKGKAICSNCINPGDTSLKGSEISKYSGVKGYCLRNKKTIVIEDISEFPGYNSDFEKKMKIKTENMICIPLLHKQNLIGILELQNGRDEPPFSKNDIELLEFISNTTAIALHNAHLFSDASERDRMKKELEFGSFMQSAILPLRKLENPYFELRADLIQTREMGGDFYDWRELEENKYMFLIADVSGKGNPAAIFMAIARSIMWTVSNFYHDPQKICEKTNEFLRNSNRIDMFVTTLLLVIDMNKRTLKYVSAGHNSGILTRENGEVIHLKTKGMPLGVIEKSTYDQKELQLESGDLLCLYTDGITETTNAQGDEFGERNLEKLVSDNRKLPIKELSNSVFNRLGEFSDKQIADDRCLILLRILEGPKETKEKYPIRSFAFKGFDKSADLIKAMEYVEQVASGGGFSRDEINDILIAVEEICVNITMYGFPQKNSKPQYTADAWIDGDKMTVVIKDKGVPFDSTRFIECPQEFNTKRLEDGGYGLLLIRELMDEISYRYDEEKGNITTLIKYKADKSETEKSAGRENG